MEINFTRYQEFLNNEINTTFEKASLFSTIFAFLCAIIIFIFNFLKIANHFLIPGIWALICSLFSFITYLIAKFRQLKGFNKYIVSFLFVSLPSIIYVIAYFYLPSKAATYITGPPSYLYAFTILMTGFMFDFRVCLISGAIAGIEYFIVYLSSYQFLYQISGADEHLLQDLRGFPMYFFKSITMFFIGIIIGIFSNNAKKLIIKILLEEKEKQSIDKLFGQYVSNEVKEKIIKEKKDIIGEKKNVVILFADIRNFSTYSENNNPEIIVEQLNQYFDRMVMCITKNGGVVDKFIGDAIMCVFGGLIEIESPSEKAIKSSFMMLKELESLNKTWEEKGFSRFENGIGLHFGEVLEGTIGSSDRKEFTVIGDTVNTASRLESLTKEHKGHSIIISDTIYNLCSSEYKNLFTFLKNTTVKGKKQSIDIWKCRF